MKTTEKYYSAPSVALRHLRGMLFVFLLTSGMLHAQVGNEEVIVVKEYEATISDAQKINIPPDIPETPDIKPVLQYNIPQKVFGDFTFETNPVKPLALSAEKLAVYNHSFIKIGFGSQLSPLVQLAYNDNKTKNLKFGILYNHLSAYGYKIKNQKYSDDEAGAYLRYYPKTFETGTAFTFRNYRTHFYSIADTITADSLKTEKNTRQVFRNYDALVYFKNAQRTEKQIDFKQTLRFNYLQETFGKANEWFINGKTDFSKTIQKVHSAMAQFEFDISRLKNDSLTLQRYIFTLAAGYSFNNDDWKAHAILGLTMDSKKVFAYADVHFEKRMYEHALIAFLDYQYSLRKNSLNDFAHTNNFIRNYSLIQNSPAGDFSAGVKGTAQNFSYLVAFHLHHIKNLPLFINDSTDIKRFLVVYDSSTTIFNYHFESGYNMKEWLRLSVMGDLNFYQLKNTGKPWHEPAFKITFRGNYIWKNKVSVSVDLFGITPTLAKLPDNTEAKIKGAADVNLSVEYLMTKHFSFFGMLNNIAHQRYQQWYGYPSYGINVMVGAKFSF